MDFVNGELERYFFDLDYSAYVIEHFPHMEYENNKFADKFTYTIDRAYERGTDLGLSDEELGLKSPTPLMNGWEVKGLTVFKWGVR